MKKIFSLLLVSMLALCAWAIPAKPRQFTVTQSDGSVLTLTMVGDEHFHYFVDVASGRKMYLGDDGDYYYVEPQRFAAHKQHADARRSDVNKVRTERLMARAAKMGVATTPDALLHRPNRVAAGTFNGAMKGSKKGLVILMEFPDRKFLSINNREAYERVFNQEGYNEYGSIGSVHDYFKDQSYGEFDLTFDVVGPYTSDHPMEFYGANEAFPGHEADWGVINDRKACFLPIEAVKKADKDVNFKDYDWDGDGEVDQVYIIYPGHPESSGAPSETIWPHESNLSLWAAYFPGEISVQYLDGVRIDTYAMSQELAGEYGSTRVGIGTACHEFAHCLGFPDIYDINQVCFGMESFDLMDNGGYNGPNYCCEVPAGFTAYERWMSGWLEPVVLKDGADVTDMQAICDAPEAYVIYNDRVATEYFLLENRQPRSWHKYVRNWTIPGGMLVTHVDFKKSAWEANIVNNDPKHQRLTLVPAGKRFGTTYMGYVYTYESDYRSMLFPGSMNVTELTDQSHGEVGLTLFNRNSMGTYNLNAPIYDIKADAAKGTISFVFKDGADDGNRWTLSFDAGAGKADTPSWTQSIQNEKCILPVATIDLEGWSFVGWSPTYVEPTDKCPATLLSAGSEYKLTADATLYAVYGQSDVAADADTYSQVATLCSGNSYVFAAIDAATDKCYALSSTSLLPTDYISTTGGKEVTLDTSATPAIVSPNADLVWTASIESGKVTLKSSKGRYLQLSDKGMMVASEPCNVAWSATYGLGTPNGSHYIVMRSRKFSIVAGGDDELRLQAYEKPAIVNVAKLFATNPGGGAGISAPTSAASATTCHDIFGRRVAGSHRQSGLYIVDGKKVIK